MGGPHHAPGEWAAAAGALWGHEVQRRYLRDWTSPRRLTDFAALQGLGFPRLPESNVVGKPPHAILDAPEYSGAGAVAATLCVQHMQYVHDVSSALL